MLQVIPRHVFISPNKQTNKNRGGGCPTRSDFSSIYARSPRLFYCRRIMRCVSFESLLYVLLDDAIGVAVYMLHMLSKFQGQKIIFSYIARGINYRVQRKDIFSVLRRHLNLQSEVFLLVMIEQCCGWDEKGRNKLAYIAVCYKSATFGTARSMQIYRVNIH